jgi:hypothetical protein
MSSNVSKCAIKGHACWQCRFMIQRNGSQGDSTSNRMMRMYAIDSIAIHSIEDDDEAA